MGMGGGGNGNRNGHLHCLWYLVYRSIGISSILVVNVSQFREHPHGSNEFDVMTLASCFKS